MFRSKLLVSAIAAAAIGFSGVALANGGTYDPGYSTPAPMNADNGSGFYLGLQAGYALTHWNNLDTSIHAVPDSVSNENGFAGRVFAGYMVNKYLGVEAGWAYLPSRVKIKENSDGSDTRVKNWAADLDGVMVVPVQEQFGVFGKVGLGYLRSKDAIALNTSINDGTIRKRDLGSWNVTFGAGAYYDITPQIRATAAWRRYEGQTKINNKYQPNPDVFLVGLQYRFSSDFLSGM